MAIYLKIVEINTRGCIGNFDAENDGCIDCPDIGKCTNIPLDFTVKGRKKKRIVSRFKEKRWIP